MAIAWMYRDDYANAGSRCSRFSITRCARRPAGDRLTLGFCGQSRPFVFGLAGPIYLVSALALGLTFIWYAIQFSRHVTDQHARQVVLRLDLYLPLLLSMLALDKINNTIAE